MGVDSSEPRALRTQTEANTTVSMGNNSPHPPPHLTDLRCNHSSSAFEDAGGAWHSCDDRVPRIRETLSAKLLLLFKEHTPENAPVLLQQAEQEYYCQYEAQIVHSQRYSAITTSVDHAFVCNAVFQVSATKFTGDAGCCCLVAAEQPWRAKRLAQAAKVLEQFKARHLCFPKLDIPSGPLASGRHEKIAVHQTVHGSKAEEILEKGLTIQKGKVEGNALIFVHTTGSTSHGSFSEKVGILRLSGRKLPQEGQPVRHSYKPSIQEEEATGTCVLQRQSLSLHPSQVHASSKRPASVGSLLLSSYLVYPVMNEQSEKGKGGICKEHGKAAAGEYTSQSWLPWGVRDRSGKPMRVEKIYWTSAEEMANQQEREAASNLLQASLKVYAANRMRYKYPGTMFYRGAVSLTVENWFAEGRAFPTSVAAQSPQNAHRQVLSQATERPHFESTVLTRGDILGPGLDNHGEKNGSQRESEEPGEKYTEDSAAE
ncbi:hypothetical protein ACRRTK_005321 [Alexandromys fortis]